MTEFGAEIYPIPDRGEPDADVQEELVVAGTKVEPGTRSELEIPLAQLPTGTWMSLPIIVLQGTQPGPAVSLSAAIHGDELNGVEIIHNTVAALEPETMAGTVIAAPIVNVFGFINESRYLPDRRDLNRSFPGSARGSLAGRIADIYMRTVIQRCDYVLDFHTASLHRTNLPQIRCDLDDEITRECAETFAAPVSLHSRTRDGSLREAATAMGATTLLFEGGEAQRFNAEAIDAGVDGTRRVLRYLGVDGGDSAPPVPAQPTALARSSKWMRANRSGILRLEVSLGQSVARHDVLGKITDAFSDGGATIRATTDALIIGHAQNPLVHRGDAILHIAPMEAIIPPPIASTPEL